MRIGHKKPGEGPSRTQRLALVAAKSGKLFETRDGLRLREQSRNLPVRMFGLGTVKQCIKLGWAQCMDQGDGTFRVMTTIAGDAALAKPMRLVKPLGLAGDYKREQLR